MTAAVLQLAPKLMETDMLHLPFMIAETMREHEADGCRYAQGAFERVMENAPPAHCPLELLEYFDQALELEEVWCLERGIGEVRMLTEMLAL
jgi:hypothetical protein